MLFEIPGNRMNFLVTRILTSLLTGGNMDAMEAMQPNGDLLSQMADGFILPVRW